MLASDQANQDDGDVSDEDEGTETNRTRAARGNSGHAQRRLKLCRDLSNLISLHRGSSTKMPSSRDKSESYLPNHIMRSTFS